MPSYSRSVDVPGKTAQELYDKISADIDKFVAKAGMGKFDIAREATSKKVTVKSSLGVTASLVCEESRIRVDAQLSLLASPFKGKIDEGINWWLNKTFPKA